MIQDLIFNLALTGATLSILANFLLVCVNWWQCRDNASLASRIAYLEQLNLAAPALDETQEMTVEDLEEQEDEEVESEG